MSKFNQWKSLLDAEPKSSNSSFAHFEKKSCYDDDWPDKFKSCKDGFSCGSCSGFKPWSPCGNNRGCGCGCASVLPKCHEKPCGEKPCHDDDIWESKPCKTTCNKKDFDFCYEYDSRICERKKLFVRPTEDKCTGCGNKDCEHSA